MKLKLYQEIVECYESLKKRECFLELKSKFPGVAENTLESIMAQEYQRKMQKTYWMHQKSDSIHQYYLNYQKAASANSKTGFLVEMADKVDLAPALLARLILEHKFKEAYPDLTKAEFKEYIDKRYKNPMLIEDGQLAAEIFDCISKDRYYGPISESCKSCVGEEYEENLRRELKKLGVSFSQEPLLRNSGFDKTPDVRLEVPIAIGDRIVNWIESKASFGDVERHKEYLVEQYARYKIRFGPGLVIYWFGFIDELNLYKRKNLFIMDHMPTDIKFMDPLKYVQLKTSLEPQELGELTKHTNVVQSTNKDDLVLSIKVSNSETLEES